MNLSAILLLIMVVVMSGCGGSKYPSTRAVTYKVQIKPILVKYCTECHASYLTGAQRQGADPADNYDTYQDAASDATAENQSIQSGAMPETPPLPTKQEKADFQAWVDEHMPE